MTFAYGEEPVLKNISFNPEIGKQWQLVGESGSGKSTISDLISRLHDVIGGEITIDNINIKQLRKRICVK